MRISDWISDVFSSDLLVLPVRMVGVPATGHRSQRRPAADDLVVAPGIERIARRPGVGQIQRRAWDQRLEALVGRKLADAFERRHIAVQIGKTVLVVRPDIEKRRSEEHTSELQSLMRISYAVFCLNKKKEIQERQTTTNKPDKDRK